MTIVDTGDEALEEVIKNNKIVLVDFWAPWCGPCRTLGEILEQLDEKIGDRAVIAKVNIDRHPASAIKHQMMGIPALRLFVNGMERESLLGVQPLHKLQELIEKYAES